MPPGLGRLLLGRLTEKPVGEKLIEVSGTVKYTSMQIVGTTLVPGTVCIYDNKGSYSLLLESEKLKKKFKVLLLKEGVFWKGGNITRNSQIIYSKFNCPPNPRIISATAKQYTK